MGYSINATEDDCYPGTSVLKNKFDIRDEAILNEVEARITSARAAAWEAEPINNDFGFEHYKAIHRRLFSDLYDWAGQTRRTNISKKGTAFCDWQQIEDEADRLFGGLLKRDCFCGLKRNSFVDEITDFYCATNYLHPFREGNGRTQRVFFTQLIRKAGYGIDFSDADMEFLMVSTIQAAQGVTDNLKRFFTEMIK